MILLAAGWVYGSGCDSEMHSENDWECSDWLSCAGGALWMIQQVQLYI